MATKSDDGVELSFAVICEKVLQESDRVMSIIRIVDSVRAERLPLPPGVALPVVPPPVISLQVAVGIRAEHGVKGSLQFVMVAPNGTPGQPFSIPVAAWPPPNLGANVVVPLQIVAQEAGIYWLELTFNSKRLTRLPLRVTIG
ncbi:MAG: hypothetical protein WA751_10240 [Candidatus Dormiibacterota bacterium]